MIKTIKQPLAKLSNLTMSFKSNNYVYIFKIDALIKRQPWWFNSDISEK